MHEYYIEVAIIIVLITWKELLSTALAVFAKPKRALSAAAIRFSARNEETAGGVAVSEDSST